MEFLAVFLDFVLLVAAYSLGMVLGFLPAAWLIWKIMDRVYGK